MLRTGAYIEKAMGLLQRDGRRASCVELENKKTHVRAKR